MNQWLKKNRHLRLKELTDELNLKLVNILWGMLYNNEEYVNPPMIGVEKHKEDKPKSVKNKDENSSIKALAP